MASHQQQVWVTFIRLSAVLCLNPLGGVTPLPLSPISWFSQSYYYSNLSQLYRRQQAGGEFGSGNIADFQFTYNPPLSCEKLCWKSSHYLVNVHAEP